MDNVRNMKQDGGKEIIITRVQIGRFDIDTWCISPFPKQYKICSKMWICQFCLKYMRSKKTYKLHCLRNCNIRNPPGKVIYNQGILSIFEVDGKQSKFYCQCLCLLGKLFILEKTICYAVENFMFYVLCEVENTEARIVGYFSKEKNCPEGYNLSCITILPPYQRKGTGI